jgi:hypothetical protein
MLKPSQILKQFPEDDSVRGVVFTISPKKGIRGPISGKMRFPDQLFDDFLKEVKNVARLALTGQVKDYIEIAKRLGISFELWTRPGTMLTKPIADAIRRGDIIQNPSLPRK